MGNSKFRCARVNNILYILNVTTVFVFVKIEINAIDVFMNTVPSTTIMESGGPNLNITRNTCHCT